MNQTQTTWQFSTVIYLICLLNLSECRIWSVPKANALKIIICTYSLTWKSPQIQILAKGLNSIEQCMDSIQLPNSEYK